LSDGARSAPSDPEAREHEIALLEACHRFPGHFSLSVIARNDESVSAAVLAAATADGEPPVDHQRQPSKGGKYVSHRLDVPCASARHAHALRLRLRALPGVINVL
jgi:putative lipoic acid-binding regulatory protein